MTASTPDQVYAAVREFLAQRSPATSRDQAVTGNRRRGARMDVEASPLFTANDDDEGRSMNTIEPLPRGRFFPYGDSVPNDATRSGRAFIDRFRLNYIQPHWFTNASITAVPGGMFFNDIGTNLYLCAWLGEVFPVDAAGTVPAILRVMVGAFDGDGHFGIVFRSSFTVDGKLSGYLYEYNGADYDLWRVDDNVQTKIATAPGEPAPVEMVAEFTGDSIHCYGIDAASSAVGDCTSNDATYRRGVVGVGFRNTDAIVGPLQVRTE